MITTTLSRTKRTRTHKQMMVTMILEHKRGMSERNEDSNSDGSCHQSDNDSVDVDVDVEDVKAQTVQLLAPLVGQWERAAQSYVSIGGEKEVPTDTLLRINAERFAQRQHVNEMDDVDDDGTGPAVRVLRTLQALVRLQQDSEVSDNAGRKTVADPRLVSRNWRGGKAYFGGDQDQSDKCFASGKVGRKRFQRMKQLQLEETDQAVDDDDNSNDDDDDNSNDTEYVDEEHNKQDSSNGESEEDFEFHSEASQPKDRQQPIPSVRPIAKIIAPIRSASKTKSKGMSNDTPAKSTHRRSVSFTPSPRRKRRKLIPTSSSASEQVSLTMPKQACPTSRQMDQQNELRQSDPPAEDETEPSQSENTRSQLPMTEEFRQMLYSGIRCRRLDAELSQQKEEKEIGMETSSDPSKIMTEHTTQKPMSIPNDSKNDNVGTHVADDEGANSIMKDQSQESHEEDQFGMNQDETELEDKMEGDEDDEGQYEQSHALLEDSYVDSPPAQMQNFRAMLLAKAKRVKTAATTTTTTSTPPTTTVAIAKTITPAGSKRNAPIHGDEEEENNAGPITDSRPISSQETNSGASSLSPLTNTAEFLSEESRQTESQTQSNIVPMTPTLLTFDTMDSQVLPDIQRFCAVHQNYQVFKRFPLQTINDGGDQHQLFVTRPIHKIGLFGKVSR